MEIDLTVEYNGIITVIEAKNNFLQDFSVYQIFHPVKYYNQKLQDASPQPRAVNACYVLREKQKGAVLVRMYLYRFTDLDRIDSIVLERKAEYRLVRR